MNDPLDELLDNFFHELRDEADGESAHAPASRAHVLAAHTKKRRRYDFLLAAAALFGVFFVAPGVWAQATGRFPGLFEAMGLSIEGPRDPLPEAEEREPRGASGIDGAARLDGDEPESENVGVPFSVETPPAPPALPSNAEVEELVAPSSRERLVQPGAEPGGEPALRLRRGTRSRREQGLFSAAHDVHFRDGAPEAALAAWDSYLSEFPRGGFAPEARYNRAVSLIRLRRFGDARRALRPFASGRYGSLRRGDAQSLLEALDARVSAEEE